MAGTPGEPVPQGQPLPPGQSGPGEPVTQDRPLEEEPGRPVWLIVLLSAVGLLLVGAIIVGLYLSQRDGDESEPATEPAPTVLPFTYDGGIAVSFGGGIARLAVG